MEMLKITISDLIMRLEEQKRIHGDIPALAAIYIENENYDSPNQGHYIYAEPNFSSDTYVEHVKPDGTVAYSYLKSENPNWNHGNNKEQKVLLIGAQ